MLAPPAARLARLERVIAGGRAMAETDRQPYRPACQPTESGSCAKCGLSYDCQRAREGRAWAWPLVALVLIAVLGVFT
jgi:hypothetical protein